MNATLLQGDARQVLRRLPEGIVRICVTSPPYFNLRDYDDPRQIGLERTPEEYVDKVVQVMTEVKRILSDDGTLWIVLGDTYAGAPVGRFNGGSATLAGRDLRGHATASNVRRDFGVPDKNLLGIPWRVAFALQRDGWFLRSEIIWHKPSILPSPVKDRPTRDHEQVFLLSKSPQYFYDYKAIREPEAQASTARYRYAGEDGRVNKGGAYREAAMGVDEHGLETGSALARTKNPVVVTDGMRNKRTVWRISPTRYKEAHFACFPVGLVEPCILAGSEEGDLVLDPFCGSGTTGEVALKHSRSFVGVELNPSYITLAKQRLGMA